MLKIKGRLLIGFLIPCVAATAQIQHTSVPVGDKVEKAYAKVSLTGLNAQPFHIRVNVSEPENPQSPYQGMIEEWWASPQQWRSEVTDKEGMRQVIVVANGHKTEKDVGDYFPFWLREFVTAISNPIPNAAAWNGKGLNIEQTTIPGAKSSPFIRTKSKIGTGSRATDAFSVLSFDPEWRLERFTSPSYSMEFQDYRAFGRKKIARKLVETPEPGTTLVGVVSVLENLKESANLFQALPTTDNRFESVALGSEQMEQITAHDPAIHWPTVQSGNTHGNLAMYISADANGHIREAWPLKSDNAGLEDLARQQVKTWTLKPPADRSTHQVQVEGGLGFVFDTTIADPIPELSDSEIRVLAIRKVEPMWPSSGVTKGQHLAVQIKVDDSGKLAGVTIAVPSAAVVPIYQAIHQWKFKPLIRDGKPQYFQGTVIFVVK